MGVTHGVTSTKRITVREAEQVARLMSALATASRVRILTQLRRAPCSVGDLADAVEMAQPAVSHQLRILRDLGLVDGTQSGRRTVYTLHDTHVAMLLDEALRHIEHLASAPPTAPSTAPGPAERRPRKGHPMTDEHDHQSPHGHEHEHGQAHHAHAHTDHGHEHVEHGHEHPHGDEVHSHSHVHQAALESEHEHAHS